MSTPRRRFAWTALLIVVGCVLEPIDLAGFPCPCTDGYECVPAVNRCVPVDEGEGAVLVRSLTADWTTPHWIHWTWQPEARDEHQLARYELHVARTVDDLLDLGGTTRLFDPGTNPELARYVLPRSGSAEVVDATFTSGHDADVEYVARLRAIDTAGRSRWSNIALTRTALAPVEGCVLADEEEDPPGYESPPPPCYRRVVGDGAFGGGEVYFSRGQVCTADNDNECEPNTDAGVCWVNLVTREMGQSLTELSLGSFHQAYLEFALAIEASDPSFWSHAGVQFLAGDGVLIPTFDEMTFPATGEYVLYQVRLDQMTITDPSTRLQRLLRFEDIEGAEVDGFRVGGSFSNGARIRLDAIALRW